MKDDHCNFFKNKIILAPMVRMNTLPFRLLALDNGADIVFGEEIIDHKILKSERRINDILGTVDYIDKSDGSLIFRTCARERDKIIFQIGTSCPERAAAAASLIERDVAGIDINMGCPKHFSVSGGMGAALLSNLPNACSIVKLVIQKVHVPVTCKIRLLEDTTETLKFCKAMEESGISAITIHGRTPKERPHHQNRNSVIREIVNNLSVPVIANGGSNNINQYEDILRFKDDTKCTSVMIARAAQFNVSVFRKADKLPLDDVIVAYLRYAVKFDNLFPNTKYCIQSMLRDLQDTPRGKLFLETQNLLQLCELWGLREFCLQMAGEYKHHGLLVQCEVLLENQCKKFKSNEDEVLSLRCSFNRSVFPRDADLPKTILLRHSRVHRKEQPKYDTRNMNKLFQSVVEFDKKKYSSSCWYVGAMLGSVVSQIGLYFILIAIFREKNKKSAEQGAAFVCLCFLKVFDENEYRSKGIIS